MLPKIGKRYVVLDNVQILTVYTERLNFRSNMAWPFVIDTYVKSYNMSYNIGQTIQVDSALWSSLEMLRLDRGGERNKP